MCNKLAKASFGNPRQHCNLHNKYTLALLSYHLKAYFFAFFFEFIKKGKKKINKSFEPETIRSKTKGYAADPKNNLKFCHNLI